MVAAEALGQVYLDRWLGRIRDVFMGQRWSAEWEEAVGMQQVLTLLTPRELLAVREEISAILRRHSDRREDPSLRPAGAKPVEFAFFNYPRQDLAASLPDERPPGASGAQTRDIS